MIRRRSAWRNLALSLVSMATGGWLAFSGFCVIAGAWTAIQLGLACAGIGAALVIFLLARTRRPRVVGLCLLILCLLRLAIAAAPRSCVVRSDGLVESRFLDGDARMWFAGVPERDVVAVGLWVGLSKAEYEVSRRGQAFMEAYDSIAEKPIFQREESVLLDSWFFDRGHYWITKRPEGKGPFPLIVFVHGHGGNFQTYASWVAPEAYRRGFVCVFPTNGFGFWGGAASTDRIARVVSAVQVEMPIGRVHLVGLSAGVPGVFDAVAGDPGKYASLVAISGPAPTMLQPEHYKGVRVLQIHGVDDHRAPIEKVREAHGKLKFSGVDAGLYEMASGHLILMTHREEVLGKVFEALPR